MASKPMKRSAGELAIAVLIGVFSLWYLSDVHERSRYVESTLMVTIVAAVIVIAVAAQIVCWIRQVREPCVENIDGSDQAEQMQNQKNGLKILGVSLAFVVYVVGLPWVGFDVGTFGFIMVVLAFQNEISLRSLATAIVGTVMVVTFLKVVIPYSVPLLLF